MYRCVLNGGEWKEIKWKEIKYECQGPPHPHFFFFFLVNSVKSTVGNNLLSLYQSLAMF